MPHARSFALIRHPSAPLVLATNGRLPAADFDEELWFSDVTDVSAAHGSSLGISLWGLRQVLFHDEADRQLSVFELMLADESSGVGAVSSDPSLEWLPVADVDIADLAPVVTDAVARYGQNLERDVVPNLRAGWARPDFPSRMREWAEGELSEIGLRVTGMDQVKQWGISSVWRLRTTGQDVYFKATGSPALFINEGVTTRGLNTLFPDVVTRPLSVLPDENWMLLPDFGQPNKFEDHDLSAEILRVHAALQRRSMTLIDELLATGCHDRRLAVMHDQIAPLLSDREATAGLQLDQIERLHAHEPVLHGLIDQLAALGIPDALVHGDLAPHNTARLDGRLIIFDWTDACVSHPFFDLMMLFLARDDALRTELRSVVAELWEDYVPEAALDTTLATAKTLFRLFLAISYRHIGHSLEPDSKPELNLTSQILADLLDDLDSRQG